MLYCVIWEDAINIILETSEAVLHGERHFKTILRWGVMLQCYNVSDLPHGRSETGLGSRIKLIEAGFSQLGLFVRHTLLTDSDTMWRFEIASISSFTSSDICLMGFYDDLSRLSSDLTITICKCVSPPTFTIFIMMVCVSRGQGPGSHVTGACVTIGCLHRTEETRVPGPGPR